ncbi:MAG: hypothetical protein GY706_06590, partial [Bacteroides sp.]|nr:hypothetical protein [Bacteroides sp.]
RNKKTKALALHLLGGIAQDYGRREDSDHFGIKQRLLAHKARSLIRQEQTDEANCQHENISFYGRTNPNNANTVISKTRQISQSTKIVLRDSSSHKSGGHAVTTSENATNLQKEGTYTQPEYDNRTAYSSSSLNKATTTEYGDTKIKPPDKRGGHGVTTLEDLDFRQDILGFSENVRSAVLLKLQQMPPQYRQDHIDEVAAHVQARIGTPKEIKNPASYLLKMCNAYLDDGELWITSRAEEFRNQAA